MSAIKGDDRVQQNSNRLQRTMQVKNTAATRNKWVTLIGIVENLFPPFMCGLCLIKFLNYFTWVVWKTLSAFMTDSNFQLMRHQCLCQIQKIKWWILFLKSKSLNLWEEYKNISITKSLEENFFSPNWRNMWKKRSSNWYRGQQGAIHSK